MRRFDQGSGRLKASIAHQDGQQGALGEERAHLLRRRAGGALGEVDEVAPGAANGFADLGVVARRPALEHQHQPVAVGHHVLVRLPHRLQSLHPRLPARRLREHGVEVVDGPPARSRGRAPSSCRRAGRGTAARSRPSGRCPRSRLRAGPCAANSTRRGVEHRDAALVGGLAGGRRRHGSEYSLTSRSCQAGVRERA